MANKENLKLGKKITEGEASILGRKGGIASGKVRAENKNLKKQLELAIDIYTDKLKKVALKNGDITLANQIEEIGVIPFKLFEIIGSSKVKAETRLKAMIDVMDRLDGKAIQKNEITGENGEPIKQNLNIKIVFVDSNNNNNNDY